MKNKNIKGLIFVMIGLIVFLIIAITFYQGEGTGAILFALVGCIYVISRNQSRAQHRADMDLFDEDVDDCELK